MTGFDAEARERALRDDAERWDTSAPVPGDTPVIDLGSPTSTVVDSLRDAGETVGFFQLVGHGVDDDLVRRTFAAAAVQGE